MTGPRFISLIALPREFFAGPPFCTYNDLQNAYAQLKKLGVAPIKCSGCAREFYLIHKGTWVGVSLCRALGWPTICADCAKDGRDVVGPDWSDVPTT